MVAYCPRCGYDTLVAAGGRVYCAHLVCGYSS